jgi:hypothetical protein
MLDNPFAQQVGIDAVSQRQARQRDARFKAGFDQLALGLRIIAALAAAIDAGDRQRSKTGVSWHRWSTLILVDTSVTVFVLPQ